jgi:hypothetical protein
MITLSIRYTIDARKRQDFEQYARALGSIIPRCGGELVGYWLPTKFAGPTNAALALIDSPSLAAYEVYRERLAQDDDNRERVRCAEESGCILVEDRAILERVQRLRGPRRRPSDSTLTARGVLAEGIAAGRGRISV